MPLSNAEKVRRHRERRKVEEEARERYDRGLPPAPPEPVAPEGAYLTSNGHERAKYGHFDAGDGTFPAIPDDIVRETITTAEGEVIRLTDCQQKQRAKAIPPRDDTVIWDAWRSESSQ